MVRKLVLHAADPRHTLANPAALVESLAGIGLTGGALPATDMAFEAGEAFLSLVTFLGCSPQVEFQPADETRRAAGHYCHVRYTLAPAHPRFRAAPGRLQPRCGRCRTPVTDWSGLVQSWPHQAPPHADCAQCGQPLRAAELNWRQAAGFGCWFVEIWNIHPHEAVPSEQLIAVLEREAGTLVRYFYE